MIRTDVFELMKDAVAAGLAIVESFLSEGKRIGGYWNFPELRQFSTSGFPRLSVSTLSSNTPKDVGGIFWKGASEGYEAWHDPESIASWRRFYEFASIDERLTQFWELRPEDQRGTPDGFVKWKKFVIFGILREMIDVYFYTLGTCKFDEN